MNTPTADLDVAMERQLFRLERDLAAGMPQVGWKICVNERKAQARLGLVSSFVGYLNGWHVRESGSTYRVRAGVMPAVEPEIAIRIGAAVSGATAAAARGAIAALAPAIEVVDYARLSPQLDVVVETSSFHDGVIIGAPRPAAAAPTIAPDCPRFLRNGAAAAVPDPSLVPADLAEVVVHVAHFLREYGQSLRPGDWIISGACTPAVRVKAGDSISADFGPLGTVRVAFAA